MTASTQTHNPELWRANDRAAQSVVPGTELGLSFQRMAQYPVARVPTRNPNTIRGSRQKPVEPFPLSVDPLDGSPIEPQPRRLGRHIIAEVARETGISVSDIMGRSRKYPIAKARHEAMKRVRAELGYSYPQIDRMFGRDHSSIIWACRGGRRGQPGPQNRNTHGRFAPKEAA